MQHSQLKLILPFEHRQMEFEYPEVDFKATLIKMSLNFCWLFFHCRQLINAT